MTRKFYIKDNNEGNGYEITGPLFFGTASKFIRFFESLNKKDDDSDTIIIDLKDCHILDYSGIDALKNKYEIIIHILYKFLNLDDKSRQRLAMEYVTEDDDEVDLQVKEIQLVRQSSTDVLVTKVKQSS